MKDRRGTERRKPVVEGHPSGADAPLRAIDAGLQRAVGARALVLVEGISDQIAIEAAARLLELDLAGAGVVVLPAGGVGSIATFALRFGPKGACLPLTGLCDAPEVAWVARSLVKAGVGMPQTRADLEALGFFVCDRDLEDELIRALGAARVEANLQANGDLAALRTLQRQGAWQAAAFQDQVRRFLGAGARRKLRYAALFVEALEPARLPLPLVRVLERAMAVAGVAAPPPAGVEPPAKSRSE